MTKHDLPLSTVQQKKKDLLKIACARGIVNIRIFGSVARGEDTSWSDIDMLVDLGEGSPCLILAVHQSSFRRFWGARWILLPNVVCTGTYEIKY